MSLLAEVRDLAEPAGFPAAHFSAHAARRSARVSPAPTASLFFVPQSKVEGPAPRGEFAYHHSFSIAAMEVALNTLTATMVVGPYLAAVFAFGALIRLATKRLLHLRHALLRPCSSNGRSTRSH